MAAGEMAFRPAETLVAAGAEPGLVEQCRRGDPQAFARLVSLHESMVFNLAARLLGDPEEAKDVAQDVFLQVYRMLPHFEGRSSLRTWIYRIVVNHCRNRRRLWRRRRRERSLPMEALSAREEARLSAGAEASPYESARRGEESALVQGALSQLAFDQRVVLLLREVEGLSGQEIAHALALPEGTVKSRLARARESLRRLLTSSEASRREA